jgi:hypothetical protein
LVERPFCGGLLEKVGIVRVGETYKHAGRVREQSVGQLSRAIERLVRHLEEEALLRVHSDGLPRGNPKESRVKSVHLVKEPSVAGTDAAGHIRIRIVEFVGIPSVPRHRTDGIDSVPEQFPARGRIACAPRKAATQSDYGYGFTSSPLGLLELGCRLVESQ